VKISQNDLGQKLKAWPSDLNLSSQIGFFLQFSCEDGFKGAYGNSDGGKV
jgi:hypothetical protein